MRRAAVLLVCGGVALATAAAATAHVTMQPAFAEANLATSVVLQTPNERAGHATTQLDIETPAGIAVLSAGAPAGWHATYDDRSATWHGGRITGVDVVEFPFELQATARAGTYRLRAAQRYEDGAVVRWDTAFTVLPSRGAAAPQEHVRRAFLAAVAGLAIVALSLVGLRRLRRRPLQDP